ncbi:B12-binding domain-containing radical SAM protein [Bacteroides sp. 224]|uniref:B12-binding domain-containing radical SAM protein n=1 Tax=Bacteroides sp. 224 TaxID=2302936 RepID=UPI0013D45853|nr:radical SAM protein [Bacteroides sp. 224]NDV64739.1 radical SAM protein [Bacteroides sp. 224]
MKTLLTTLNAKYIHTSLALRWLYVANQSRHDICFKEYSLKENTTTILEELLATQCDIIGLSVYIWNVTRIGEIIHLFKQRNPQLIIIVGGPEVTYEPAYFLNTWPVDYVISGEGEFVLGELLEAIEQGKEVQIDGVSSRNYISPVVAKADLEKLAELPSPYMLEEDKESISHRLVYFETSRGCPYQCQYCLSSREKGVRYFPKDYLFKNLAYLIEAGAKQIKFLDRTFNLDKQHTREVFDFLIQNYREGLSCQFEVYADLLTDEVIDYLNTNLPDNYFRFEIGIQSTYEPTNVAVKRKQNFPLLAGNIKKLMEGGKITLHLDLIAGLPYETYDRFVRSFNDVFVLGGKEVQLGFLKMLRGTNLRKDAAQYGYRYNDAAPYEILDNADISAEELHRIHEAEHALERFWNSGRFPNTMHKIFQTYYKGRYFEFFDEVAKHFAMQQFPHRGYQLEDLFATLHQFLLSRQINLFEELRTDYYGNFSMRPPGFWEDSLDKTTKKRVLHLISEDKEFLRANGLTHQMIRKQTAINLLEDNSYLLTVFVKDIKEVRRIEVIYQF